MASRWIDRAQVVLFPSLLVLAACGSDEAPGDPPPTGRAVGEAASEAPSQPQRHLGTLVLEGGPVFVPCGEWDPIVLDGPATPDLLGLYAELVPGGSDEGIFIDVLGQVRVEEGTRWLDALEVRRASYEGSGCGSDAPGVLLQASGTEPFWGLSVTESGAEWRTPDDVKRFVHTGVARMPRGGWVVEVAGDGDDVPFRAEFLPGPCRNAMSGAWSHLSVEVRQAESSWTGCGHRTPLGETPG